MFTRGRAGCGPEVSSIPSDRSAIRNGAFGLPTKSQAARSGTKILVFFGCDTVMHPQYPVKPQQASKTSIPLGLPTCPLPRDAALVPHQQQLRWSKPQAKAIWKQHLTPACFERLSGNFLAPKQQKPKQTGEDLASPAQSEGNAKSEGKKPNTCSHPLFPFPAVGQGMRCPSKGTKIPPPKPPRKVRAGRGAARRPPAERTVKG